MSNQITDALAAAKAIGVEAVWPKYGRTRPPFVVVDVVLCWSGRVLRPDSPYTQDLLCGAIRRGLRAKGWSFYACWDDATCDAGKFGVEFGVTSEYTNVGNGHSELEALTNAMLEVGKHGKDTNEKDS